MSVEHKTKAVAFTCIDFRFQQIINADLKKRGLEGKVDKISIAGTSKDFETVSHQAEISLRLHDPDQALIYEHEDCGAYDQDNSVEIHKANAQKLASSLKEIKPTLAVEILIAMFDGIKPL